MSLTFTVTNPNQSDLTGVAISDTLPSGLVVATPNNVSNACGGTVTAAAGTGAVSLASGTLSGGAQYQSGRQYRSARRCRV
jgi:uncharacterized repeat protein (TIGR01451 family)